MSLRVVKMWSRVKASQRKLCLHPAGPPETILSALSTLPLTGPPPSHTGAPGRTPRCRQSRNEVTWSDRAAGEGQKPVCSIHGAIWGSRGRGRALLASQRNQRCRAVRGRAAHFGGSGPEDPDSLLAPDPSICSEASGHRQSLSDRRGHPPPASLACQGHEGWRPRGLG